MPTPKLLAQLADPRALEERFRLLAIAGDILSPDFPCFEFHPKWRRGERMGAYKDDEGNAVFAWFTKGATVIRGFDHECPISAFRSDPPKLWAGLVDGFPKSLGYALREPAFGGDELTFLIWRFDRDHAWHSTKPKLPRAKDPDGSVRLLGALDGVEYFKSVALS